MKHPNRFVWASAFMILTACHSRSSSRAEESTVAPASAGEAAAPASGNTATAPPDAPGNTDTAAGAAPAAAARCSTDADCRTFSDYCTGCDCRALSNAAQNPGCSGPGVRCFADPCMGKRAACNTSTGACEIR